MWGNGYQADRTNDFSNFTPKHIRSFEPDGSRAHVVDAAFGWYHEAYIDSRGSIHVCPKHALSSVEIEGTDDHERATEEIRIPGETVKQVSFT